MNEHATAYHALNTQLKEELPVFLKGVEKIVRLALPAYSGLKLISEITKFTAIVQRFVTLQVAFNERMAEAWQEYVQSCCTQLGSPEQSAKESISRWWQMHSSLAKQLDSLRILDADKVIQDVERRQRNSLPPALRPRLSGGPCKRSGNFAL